MHLIIVRSLFTSATLIQRLETTIMYSAL